jgi:hypothetical protein
MPDPTATTAIEEPPGGDAVALAEPGRAVETLQKQVREKDQLVAALTERLEQAAEQLDRLRRTGANKGNRPLAGGAPADLAPDQKQTFDDLKKFIGNWEEIQPGAALQRIETQVVEIRNLISAGVTIGSAAPSAGAAVRDRSAPPSGTAPAAAPAKGAAPAKEKEGANSSGEGGKTSNSSWWEKQKAAMLGEGPAPTEDESTSATVTAESSRDGNAVASTMPPFSLSDTVIPDLPAAVNYDDLALDEAKQAIRVRDQLIQQLREPLLLLKAAGQLPSDLASLDNIPTALRQRVEELESQWQAKFRQAELDLSLERARLAREQSQMRQQQDLLNKQLKKNGISQKEPEGTADGDDGNSNRRWFRFMGKADGGKEPAGNEPK